MTKSWGDPRQSLNLPDIALDGAVGGKPWDGPVGIRDLPGAIPLDRQILQMRDHADDILDFLLQCFFVADPDGSISAGSGNVSGLTTLLTRGTNT